ncbi:MAG: NYN domain-containing protein [Bdellovibrionota bacterium]
MQESSIKVTQSVAILVDGNNIERSLSKLIGNEGAMLNFDTTIPKLLNSRGLNRLIYFREGRRISSKLEERLHTNYYGSVIPCHKSADIPLSIKATQLASKVDTIIIMSGDSDYIELVKHLQGEGVRVEIAAIEESTSQELIDRCDYFHPITEEDQFVYVGAKVGSSKTGRPNKSATKAVAKDTSTDTTKGQTKQRKPKGKR